MDIKEEIEKKSKKESMLFQCQLNKKVFEEAKTLKAKDKVSWTSLMEVLLIKYIDESKKQELPR